MWIKTEEVADKYRQLILEMQTDKGEASAIALALEKSGSLIILEDYRGRRIAERLGLKFTGTIGVLTYGDYSFCQAFNSEYEAKWLQAFSGIGDPCT